MRFVLSANRANDPSNTAFWIDIGTEHFPPYWLLGVSKHPRVCKHRPDPTFFTCIGKLTRDYRSTQSRVLRDLITSVLYEERGSSVFCGFVRIILSRLIIQKYFCLIIRYVFIFSFMFAPLEIHCMWHMYIATFTLLVI